MNCKEVETLIASFAMDLLSKPIKAHVQWHLNQCESCQQLLQHEQTTEHVLLESFAALRNVEAPTVDLTKSILDEVVSVKRPKPQLHWSWLPNHTTFAFAILVVGSFIGLPLLYIFMNGGKQALPWLSASTVSGMQSVLGLLENTFSAITNLVTALLSPFFEIAFLRNSVYAFVAVLTISAFGLMVFMISYTLFRDVSGSKMRRTFS